MTFNIDDDPEDAYPDKPAPKSAMADGFKVDYRGRLEHAERTSRQIVAAIEEMETVADLDEYLESESILLDAMHLSAPQYADRISAAYADHKEMLTAAALWEQAKTVKHNSG